MSHAYEETVSRFRHLEKEINLRPDLTETELRVENGYTLYVFDVRNQNRNSAQQLIKVVIRVSAEIEESS